METTYIIHTYFEHCSVYYNDKNYSYQELKEVLNKRGKKYIKKNKEKKNSTLLENYNDNFEKSNLTDEELKEFYINKKKSQFNYWKTKLRNLRKKGRLEKSKIDKLNEFGMLWNPSNDSWEIMYEKFKNKFIIEIIKNSFVDGFTFCLVTSSAVFTPDSIATLKPAFWDSLYSSHAATASSSPLLACFSR